MDENKLSRDDNIGEKLKQINQLETGLSKAIIQLMGCFSDYSILKNIDLDKNTIKDHKKKGEIPPKHFEQYIRALGKANRPSTEIQESKIKCGTYTLEEWETSVQKCYRELNDVYEEYKKIVGAEPYLLDSVFRKGKTADNVVPEVLSQQLEKSVTSIKERIKRHKIDDLSPQFFHHLNICFDAFSAITPNDFLFLTYFFRGSKEGREKVLARMNEKTLNSATDTISCLTSGSGKLWLAAYTHYLSNNMKRNTQSDNWKKLKEKVEGNFSKSEGIEKQKNTLAFYYFLALIWPEEGETDTKFGPEEIKALIIFKYFLTEESRQELIDEFYEGQPKD